LAFSPSGSFVFVSFDVETTLLTFNKGTKIWALDL